MTQHEWTALFPFHFGPSLERQVSLILARPGQPHRGELEAFIHDRFAAMHQADVRHYLPELIGLQDHQGHLIAAVGLRPASNGPLFLERYLDEPLEAVVCRQDGRVVRRSELVEVGNLAASSAGGARLIIIAITWLLAIGDFKWVSFTGGPSLVNSFNRLGLQPLPIAEADPARLNGDAASWGNYYQQRPQVHIGQIGSGHKLLKHAGVYRRLGLPLFGRVNCNAA